MARHASGQDDGPLSSMTGNQLISVSPRHALKHPTHDPPSPHQNRLSEEQDVLYQEVIKLTSWQLAKNKAMKRPTNRGRSISWEPPPPYTCPIHAEAVLMMKLEVENATKRAQDRSWHQVYAIVHGTTLNIYHPKRDWGWGKKADISNTGDATWDSTRPSGPSDDNPLGIKAGKLIKPYGLLHGEVGIASDYRKRKYVLRVRADADQFLLSCRELETFICWLDNLFAAIDITAPLEDRDFPRDQSIPRVQRLRVLRAESTMRSPERPQPSTRFSPTTYGTAGALARAAGVERRGPVITTAGDLVEHSVAIRETPSHLVTNFDRAGKWSPRHAWTRRHDMLYAKLCYSTLLFRSPRKSSYVIMKDELWFVDWPTGRMARAQPPAYWELGIEAPPVYKPFIENSRIQIPREK